MEREAEMDQEEYVAVGIGRYATFSKMLHHFASYFLKQGHTAQLYVESLEIFTTSNPQRRRGIHSCAQLRTQLSYSTQNSPFDNASQILFRLFFTIL